MYFIYFIPSDIANNPKRMDNQSMNYMDVKEASRKWGITDRRIRILCNEGRVDGAVKLGWSWTIPENAPKPRDGRVLRRFKNLDIRPGSVDVSRLEYLKTICPINDELKTNPKLESFIAKVLSIFLRREESEISLENIKSIYSGQLIPSLTLEDHLIVLNFRSIFLSLIDKKDRWFERDIKETYVRLMQGIDDIGSSRYREGFTRYAIRGKEKVKVAVQMETLFSQYENSWKNLNGLIYAVLLYGELMRIEPYSKYMDLFSYLIMAGELFRSGLLPPLFDNDDWQESRALFSLALKRGNFCDFTHFIERAVNASYGELSNV